MFDFFGTLVDYTASRTTQRFDRSWSILRDAGCPLGYAEWLVSWDSVFADLERAAEASGREFSMHEMASVFADMHGCAFASPAALDELIDVYLAEWGEPVRAVDGAAEMLARLRAGGTRLAVVSNTHHAPMVHRFIADLGFSGLFDEVVTSVECRWRKPRPEIYAEALARMTATAESTVFVGDSWGPDYHGPTFVGMSAYLIGAPGDPTRLVPAHRTLGSVLEIEHIAELT